jgi:hypothetical protein
MISDNVAKVLVEILESRVATKESFVKRANCGQHFLRALCLPRAKTSRSRGGITAQSLMNTHGHNNILQD